MNERMKKRAWSLSPEPLKDKVFGDAIHKGLGRCTFDNYRWFPGANAIWQP